MNMTVIIELTAAHQTRIMNKYKQFETLTQLAEAQEVQLTFCNQTEIELSGRTTFVFSIVDEWQPKAIRIVEVDEL
jgi:predicted ribosome-associated RNA-binding protein Tma20